MMRFVLVILTANLTFEKVSTDCGLAQGKTTCITEDMLQMLMKLNREPGPVSESKKRPAFTAYLKTTSTYSTGQNVKFDDVATNVGNHYKPSNGVFTVPKNGLYLLSCMIMSGDNNSLHFRWIKNEKAFSNIYVAYTNSANSQSQSFVIHLKKGDRIHIVSVSNNHKMHGSRYSFISGYLL